MARYCSPQLSVRTRLSPPYRATIRLKVFHGRNSISWAKSVLPVFIGDSRDHPGSLLRLQIVDTAFCSETRRTPGAQSRWPSVNRTAVIWVAQTGCIRFGNYAEDCAAGHHHAPADRSPVGRGP